MRQACSLIVVIALGGVAAADTKPNKAAVKSKGSVDSLDAGSIVARHLQAVGGVELLRAVKSMKYTLTEQRDGVKVSKTVTRARPNKMRVEVQEGDTLTVKVFDGEKGWVKKGTAAVEAMPKEKLAGMKTMAEFDDALLDFAKKGHAVKLLGTVDVKGAPAYELELRLASGEVERRFIDTKSFMEVRRVHSYTHDGKTVESAIHLGDYREVSGQMVNHWVEYERDGKPGKMVLTSVAFDVRVEDALFAMPKK